MALISIRRPSLLLALGLVCAPFAMQAQGTLTLVRTPASELPPPTRPPSRSDSAEVMATVARAALPDLVMDGVKFVLHPRTAQMGGRDRSAEANRALGTLLGLSMATGAEVLQRQPGSTNFDPLPAGVRAVIVSDPVFYSDSARISISHHSSGTRVVGGQVRQVGAMTWWQYRLVREGSGWRVVGASRFWGG